MPSEKYSENSLSSSGGEDTQGSSSGGSDSDEDPERTAVRTTTTTTPVVPLIDSIDALNDATSDAMAMIGRYAVVEPFPDSEEDDPKHANNPWKDMPAVCADLASARERIRSAWDTAKAAHDRECPSEDWLDRGIYDESDSDDDDKDKKDGDDDEAVFRARGFALDLTQTVDLDVTASIIPPAFHDSGVRGDDEKEEEENDDKIDDDEEEEPRRYRNRRGETKNEEDVMPADDFRTRYIEMMTEAFADDLEAMNDEEGVNVNVLVEALESGIDLLEPHEKNRRSFFDNLESPVDEIDDGRTVHQRRQKELGWLTDDGDEPM